MESIERSIDISADEITPEAVAKGVIIRIHPNELIWRTDSGKIDLNALVGNVCHEIKPGSLSSSEADQVYNGIRTGRILCVKKFEKGSAPNIEMSFDPNAPTARKILDLPDSEFESTVLKFKRVHILELALGFEAQDKRRKDRMDFIRKQISIVSDK